MQRGKPWRRGESGNPAGRKQGSRNKASLLCDEIAEGRAGDLVRSVLERGLAGDIQAASLILSRVWPRRSARVRFTLPEIVSTADLPHATAAVLQQVADGILAPDEAAAIATLLEAQRQALQLADIEQRLAALERQRYEPA